MIKEENLKIITLSFVIVGFLVALSVRVLLESLTMYSGWMAQIYAQEIIRHGVPVLAGLSVFAYLQFKKNIGVWAQEVVVEVRKVVWPSQKATAGMTVMVCVVLLISGFVLGLFDLVGGVLIDFIIN